ncbi:MAG: maleylpyruvate isomerase family mycothiol-dependent enzyme, partial [Acidimicrobiales bacterium]
MQEIVRLLEEQQTELAGLVVDLDDDRWSRPSACEGWSISDVILHLAQSNEMAIGSTRGTFDVVLSRLLEGAPPAANVDEGAEAMVVNERGRPPAEVHERWRRSCSDLRQGLLAHEPGDRLQWVAGDVAARTLATTRLAETWIHAGDVAAGLDVELEPTDRLWHIARLAWRTIPYAFQRAGAEPPGPVAFRLVGPSGAAWSFGDDDAPTVITGSGYELCQVAAQRRSPSDTSLTGNGPDADRVLQLVRTFA